MKKKKKKKLILSQPRIHPGNGIFLETIRCNMTDHPGCYSVLCKHRINGGIHLPQRTGAQILSVPLA